MTAYVIGSLGLMSKFCLLGNRVKNGYIRDSENMLIWMLKELVNILIFIIMSSGVLEEVEITFMLLMNVEEKFLILLD